jgi:hypothetical protein
MNNTTFDNLRTASNRLLFALIILITLFVIAKFMITLENASFILPFVLIAGALGSFVSLQRRLKQLSEDDLLLMCNSLSSVWLPPITGALLAAILYMLFIGNLISGSLFPVFQPPLDINPSLKGFALLAHIEAASVQDYAKLIFWSFLAGFSESFVTNIMGTFETKAQQNVENIEP